MLVITCCDFILWFVLFLLMKDSAFFFSGTDQASLFSSFTEVNAVKCASTVTLESVKVNAWLSFQEVYCFMSFIYKRQLFCFFGYFVAVSRLIRWSSFV